MLVTEIYAYFFALSTLSLFLSFISIFSSFYFLNMVKDIGLACVRCLWDG